MRLIRSMAAAGIAGSALLVGGLGISMISAPSALAASTPGVTALEYGSANVSNPTAVEYAAPARVSNPTAVEYAAHVSGVTALEY
jgi:hypothetical protein